jgi:hypothetical protein
VKHINWMRTRISAGMMHRHRTKGTSAVLPATDLIAQAEAEAERRAAQFRPPTLDLARLTQAFNSRRLA